MAATSRGDDSSRRHRLPLPGGLLVSAGAKLGCRERFSLSAAGSEPGGGREACLTDD